jgi:hypothetical protein
MLLNGRRILELLLTADFRGSLELRKQFATAQVRLVVSKGSPALLIRVSDDAIPADVATRVPVEGHTSRQDGSAIHCLLHVVKGKLAELEFYREDGEPIDKLPEPSTFRVTVTG